MKRHNLETSTHHTVAATLTDICGSTIGMRREEIKAERPAHEESIPGNLGEGKQNTDDTPRYRQRECWLHVLQVDSGNRCMESAFMPLTPQPKEIGGKRRSQGAIILSEFPASQMDGINPELPWAE
jgi:hypothetical protein